MDQGTRTGSERETGPYPVHGTNKRRMSRDESRCETFRHPNFHSALSFFTHRAPGPISRDSRRVTQPAGDRANSLKHVLLPGQADCGGDVRWPVSVCLRTVFENLSRLCCV